VLDLVGGSSGTERNPAGGPPQSVEVRASIAGEALALLGLAYLVESPLVLWARAQIAQEPSLQTFWIVLGVFFFALQVPLALLFVSPQAVAIRVEPSGIFVVERQLVRKRTSRLVNWRELRSVERLPISIHRVALYPEDILRVVYLSYEQASAVVSHPACPQLSFVPARLSLHLLKGRAR